MFQYLISSIVRVYKKHGLKMLVILGFEYFLLELSRFFPFIVKFFTPRLFAVSIEPTNACNLRCQICYSQNPETFKARNKGYMDWETYKNCIDELSSLDYPVSLGLNFGGESLLHPKFCDMVSYAKSKGISQISFNTNGMLLSENIINNLVENKVSKITISLDGTKEKHESSRIGSDYDTVEKNILNLKRLRGNSLSPKIFVNLIEYDQSIEEINEFINYWINIVDSVAISSCISENLQIMNTEKFFQGNKIIKKHYCHWPFYYLSILWNGDVTSCCHEIGGRIFLGNVVKSKIMDIWKSNKYKEFRREAITNNFSVSSPCHKCNAWNTEFVSKKLEYNDDIDLEFLKISKIYKKKN